MREKKIPERQTSLHCAECLCGRYFESYPEKRRQCERGREEAAADERHGEAMRRAQRTAKSPVERACALGLLDRVYGHGAPCRVSPLSGERLKRRPSQRTTRRRPRVPDQTYVRRS